MDIRLLGQAQQQNPEVLSDGNESIANMTRVGQLFTADWKMRLLLAGRVWRVSVGGLTAGGNVAMITGGAGGTTIDQDRPEIAIGVDTGYFLVPLEIDVACQVDLDADGEEANIIVTVDRTAGVPTPATSTVEVPANQLDGGVGFPGVAYSAVITADIADPTQDEILQFRTIQASDFIPTATAAAGAAALAAKFEMHYEPTLPDLIKGPCGLYVYWGGTAAVLGMASVLVAAIPVGWFE